MKTGSTALQNMLKRSDSIPLTQQLTAEWNYNRYATVTSIDNNPTLGTADTLWSQLFPIASIVAPDRPTAGIVKAFTDEAPITTDLTNVSSGYRSYPCDIKDPYKYWISPSASGNAKDSTGGYPFSTACVPTVIYSAQLQTNKIVVTFENSIVSPWDFAIDISTDGTTWNPISVNPSIPANGQIVLYLQSNGAWAPGASYNNGYVALKGLRVRVNSINAAGKYAQIIEMSPRREDDITSYMSAWTVNYEQSNRSFLAPLGQISSNTGSITLFNDSNIWDNESSSSPYVGMIDKNVRFILQTGIDTTSMGGSGTEWIREFTMISVDWSGQKTPTVTVNIADSSEKLKTVYPPELMFQNLNAGQIIWRLMDIMGYSNYSYHISSNDSASTIPFYWTSGDNTLNAVAVRKNRVRYLPTKNTLWDEFNRICEGTQLAVYFDAYDNMQIKSREYEFDSSRATTWTLRGQAGGGELASIVDWSQQGTYESNHVDVQYTPTAISDNGSNRYPVMETVWTPPTDTTLRSAPLAGPITSTGNGWMLIRKDDAQYWEYSGMVQVDGEIMSYSGKEYTYHKIGGGLANEYIYDIDRKKVIDQTLSDPKMAWANEFSGKLMITQRGVNDTDAVTHSSTANSYYLPIAKDGSQGETGRNPYCFRNNNDSTITVTTNNTYSAIHQQLIVPSNGQVAGGPQLRMGTRFRIKSGIGSSKKGRAGLFFNTDPQSLAGYFVSVTTTDECEDLGRKAFNEVWIWTKGYNGQMAITSKGTAFPVTKDAWYNLDVEFDYSNPNNHLITAYINGTQVATASLTGTSRVTTGALEGMFVGEYCAVDFEYYYAATHAAVTDIDSTSFMDKVTGGFSNDYASRQLNLPFPVARRKNANLPYWKWRYATTPYFDDFGAYAHEVRQFSVDFDKNPSLHSRLFISNDQQIACMDYNSDPFGADFTLVNTSRNNAVLTGSDTLMYGINNPVTQQCFIYGRLVTQATSPGAYTAEDPVSIRKRGYVNSTFNSMWIQTKDQAAALAAWVVGHWSKGQQEVDIKVFGASLIEVGDLITIDWPTRGFTAGQNKWYVVKVSANSNQGIDHTITVRRSNI